MTARIKFDAGPHCAERAAAPRSCRAATGRNVMAWLILLAAWIATSGCSSNNYLTVRKVPRNPLAGPLQLFSWKGPQPTQRTEQLLRRYDLATPEGEPPPVALAGLQKEIAQEPNPEKIYSFAELAYINGQRASAHGDDQAALDLYAQAADQAYRYLFDGKFDLFRNPYDPQFRQACDLYNGSLEAAMRIMQKRKNLKPGASEKIKTPQGELEIVVKMQGPWPAEEVERLEFVTEFEVKGLANKYHTYGLGVPLIAARRTPPHRAGAERFYPEGLCFPLTAFLRVQRPSTEVAQVSTGAAPGPRTLTLELVDPMAANQVRIGERLVPLETDLSTPLGFFLDNPRMKHSEALATLGLFKPNATAKLEGIYMLEPYSPHKIPVLMVHGLWSSPMTWMEMFNDLRSLPEVRDHYQFWFYLYPTGQPFWVSAAKLRDDLQSLRQTLDPRAESAELKQMVLVGHSMGGLVSMMQTVESRDEIWKLVSDKPISELKVDTATREQLAKLAFFQPDPNIRRVVTIGTPHHGSHFANEYTRWLGHKLIALPNKIVQVGQGLMRDNPEAFRDSSLLKITMSIDSLAPDSPLFRYLDRAERAPWVKYHNIIGLIPQKRFIAKTVAGSDGIVSFQSARLEGADPEMVVPAKHTEVHRHPRSILAVRGFLLDHLAELQLAPLTASNNETAASPPVPATFGSAAPVSGFPATNAASPAPAPSAAPNELRLEGERSSFGPAPTYGPTR